MSQTISIANRPRINPKWILRGKPKVSDDIVWRIDGEENQLILVSKEDLALPLILNPTAARLFLLCNGKNTLEDMARKLCDEFSSEDFKMVLGDVKVQIEYFLNKGIIEI